METFLGIDDAQLLTEIFPEGGEIFKKLEKEYLGLCVAKMALSKGCKANIKSLAYRNFAINTIYKILYNNHSCEEVLKKINFSTREFFELSSSNYLVSCNLNDMHVKKKSFIAKFKKSIFKRIEGIKNKVNENRNN